MNLAAIRHFATAADCICLEPGRFLIRLSAARGDLTRVILHTRDKHVRWADTRMIYPMHRAVSDTTLDYWETELRFDVLCLRYWFELTDCTGKTVFLSNFLFLEQPPTDINDMFDCPQNLREEERFVTPAWAENKVIYQIFPSRFAPSEPVPDSLWYKAPMSFTDDLHGNLRGIISHLEHLRELGVDILYMTPIFLSDSCHKYDTIDYYTVDPSFGTKEDLKELVEKAHEMGLRVILDGVFNHTSPKFFAFADVKEKQEQSHYLDWYFIDSFPLRANWGEKPNFKTFAYYGGMPKLNVRNPEVARYVLDVALYWLRECHIDGWRLDVADEIGHRFWRRFREEVKAEFPETIIIGENWHHAEDFLRGDEWDSVMNYPFYQSVLALAARSEITVSQFTGVLSFQQGQLHPKVIPLLWNIAGSHDTPRLLRNCGGSRERMKLAAALQLLLPGMPMIYYGDEFAMDGGEDPDCRRGMVWDSARQDRDMFRWYQTLIRARKSWPQLLSRACAAKTDDEAGLLLRCAGNLTLAFCCGEQSAALPEFTGCRDLLTGEIFSGTLPAFGTALLER